MKQNVFFILAFLTLMNCAERSFPDAEISLIYDYTAAVSALLIELDHSSKSKDLDRANQATDEFEESAGAIYASIQAGLDDPEKKSIFRKIHTDLLKMARIYLFSSNNSSKYWDDFRIAISLFEAEMVTPKGGSSKPNGLLAKEKYLQLAVDSFTELAAYDDQLGPKVTAVKASETSKAFNDHYLGQLEKSKAFAFNFGRLYQEISQALSDQKTKTQMKMAHTSVLVRLKNYFPADFDDNNIKVTLLQLSLALDNVEIELKTP